MSWLTICNYCSMRSLQARATKEKMVITKFHHEDGSVDVFVHPPDIKIETDRRPDGHPAARSDDHPQQKYWRRWFMHLPDHCCCGE